MVHKQAYAGSILDDYAQEGSQSLSSIERHIIRFVRAFELDETEDNLSKEQVKNLCKSRSSSWINRKISSMKNQDDLLRQDGNGFKTTEKARRLM